MYGTEFLIMKAPGESKMHCTGHPKDFFYITIILAIIASFNVASANPIFPGAFGFGTDTRGAYGAVNKPIICIVTNLNHNDTSVTDSTRNGVVVKTGSLRGCIEFNPPLNTGKVILFETSGTINATAEPFIYNIKQPYTAIYGQTAPSPGITLRNITVKVRTHDTIVQHLRVRVGDDIRGYTPEYRDCIKITAGDEDIVENIVIDHCSFSWSIDELAEIYNNSKTGIVKDVTISNCILAEGLKNSLHREGAHSKGVIVSSTGGCAGPSNISILKNIISNCTDRTPMIANATDVIVANNIFYNNEWFNVLWAPFAQNSKINIIENVGLGGPFSGKYIKNDIVTLWDHFNDGIGSFMYLKGNRVGEYVNGNLVWNGIQGGQSDQFMIDNRKSLNISAINTTSQTVQNINAENLKSSDLLSVITESAGARPTDRDAVDIRIINDVKEGTGKIINSPSEVGGWPDLPVKQSKLVIPSKPHGDDDEDGYTNLEEWIHSYTSVSGGLSSAANAVSNAVPPKPTGLKTKLN